MQAAHQQAGLSNKQFQAADQSGTAGLKRLCVLTEGEPSGHLVASPPDVVFKQSGVCSA